MTSEKQVYMFCTSGSTTATVSDPPADMVDKYVYVGNAWNKVTAVSGNSVTLENAASVTGTFASPLVVMNEIEITGDNLTLTRLEADYFPVIV